MSLDSFLQNPYGHNEGDGQQKPVIAKASVWPAWEVSFGAEKTYFEYKSDDTGENEAEAKGIADSVASGDGYVNLGIVVIIQVEDAIQSNFNEDWYSFVPAYHSKKKFYVTQKGAEKLQENGHLDNVQALIDNGHFPYDTAIEHLKQNPTVFQAEKWCRLIQKDETVLKAKGVKSKSGYTIQFFVVEKVYESRDEALADNKVDETDNQVSQPVVNTGTLSDTAITNNWTLAALQENTQTITLEIIELSGQYNNGPEALPLEKAVQEAKKIIAINWVIEVADFDLLDLDDFTEVPF